jgi:hypothetical protein
MPQMRREHGGPSGVDEHVSNIVDALPTSCRRSGASTCVVADFDDATMHSGLIPPPWVAFFDGGDLECI